MLLRMVVEGDEHAGIVTKLVPASKVRRKTAVLQMKPRLEDGGEGRVELFGLGTARSAMIGFVAAIRMIPRGAKHATME
jgi:hypothetical protein